MDHYMNYLPFQYKYKIYKYLSKKKKKIPISSKSFTGMNDSKIFIYRNLKGKYYFIGISITLRTTDYF